MLILCDFDGELPEDLNARLEMVARVQRLHVRWYRIDRTKHGYHMVVNVTGRIGMLRTVLIQSLLGSDWKRETFNSRRAMLKGLPAYWRSRFNVLYHRHFREISV